MEKILQLFDDSGFESARERARNRVSEAFARVAHSVTGKEVTSFEEAMQALMDLMTNKPGWKQHKWRYAMEEAGTTSDFPILFGNVIERQLYALYTIAKPAWQAYIGQGAQRDLTRDYDILSLFGMQSRLQKVAQRGEYKARQLKEGKVSCALSKYGAVWPITWESLLADDIGAFADAAQRFVNAALRTELYEATALFVAAAGPHTGLFGDALAHPLTGQVIDNKDTRSFTLDNLGLAMQDMRSQIDVDGEPIVIDGFELVVAPALEVRMLKALNPAAVVIAGTAGAVTKDTSANVVAGMNITGHINPYLPIIDASGNKNFTWYLFAKLANGRAAQLNKLRGRETPELVMKKSDKVAVGGGDVDPMEGDFATDTANWRVRHCLGGVRIDPQMARAEVNNA